jgi:tRNA 2-(methylsulfanyl)-N6-isopentenyladenosine37 hydroxylase
MPGVFEELSEFIPLKVRTPPEWTQIALSDMNAFMVDHAFCERKASANALSLVMSNQDKPDFCEALIQLSLEELEHFHQVFRMMKSRGLRLEGDGKDPYVNALLALCRKQGEKERFLDRLLVFGIVEARGCERFALVGEASPDPDLRAFYDELARAEARHFGLFLRYSRQYCGVEMTSKRLDELLVAEAEILQALPWRASLH